MTLRLLVHNVGHGHAIHAFTPAGHVIVFDLGRSEVFSPLKWLRGFKEYVDLLVVTHPHGDHIDEIEELSNLRFQVRQFTRPGWLLRDEVSKANLPADQGKVQAYFAWDTGMRAPIPKGQAVSNPLVSGGVSIRSFVSPDLGRSNINNHSVVTVLDYLGLKILVPGDNEPPSWNALMAQSEFVAAVRRSDVMVASHHGRESGYSAELMKLVQPRLSIISDSRVQDTNASSRYSADARGWDVWSRSANKSVRRRCVTTRSDGYVEMKIGWEKNGRPYLHVSIR